MSKNNNNNKKIIVTWPEGHFTIEDLTQKNPDVVPITLRFRVMKAVDMGELTEIGKVNPPIGRPRKVFAKANPSVSVIEAATKAGVVLVTNTVPVADVKAVENTTSVTSTNNEQVVA